MVVWHERHLLTSNSSVESVTGTELQTQHVQWWIATTYKMKGIHAHLLRNKIQKYIASHEMP